MQAQYIDYVAVRTIALNDLVKDVKKYLEAGYVPTGGITLGEHYINGKKEIIFIQPMAKPAPKE